MLQLGNKLQKIRKKMARKPKETMRLIQCGLTERQQQGNNNTLCSNKDIKKKINK